MIYDKLLYILHNFNVFIRHLHRININTLLATHNTIGNNIFILQLDFFSLNCPLEKFSIYVINVAANHNFEFKLLLINIPYINSFNDIMTV